MAGAKTVTELPPQTVTATLSPGVTDSAFHVMNIYMTPGLLCTVWNKGKFTGPAQGEEEGEGEEGEEWLGEYWWFHVQAMSDEDDVFAWLGDSWTDPDEVPEEFEAGKVVVGVPDFEATLTLVGVHLSAIVTEDEPITREFMGVIDRNCVNKWLVDSSSTYDVELDWGDGSVSEAGGWGVGEQGEYADMPSNIGMSVYPKSAGDGDVQCSITGWTVTGVSCDVGTLYYIGDTPYPDPVVAPYWGRSVTGSNYLQVVDGVMTMIGSRPLWDQLTGFGAKVWLPVDVTFEPETYKHARTVPQEYAVEVVGPPIEWTDTEPLGENTSSPLPFTGPLQVTQQRKSWLFPEEWQRLDDLGVSISTTGAWCTANAEEGKFCPLILHPINASIVGNPTTTWPAFVDILHLTDLEIINPSGVSRPADWVGSGGATCDGGNNDLWRVAAESASPSVSIALATRKWARLDRLEEHTADIDYKNADLIFINKANVDTLPYAPGIYLDDVADRIDENRTHWGQFTWLELKINAPRTAEISVTIGYSTVEMTFGGGPYTCFTHTFGTLGEFGYTRYQFSVTYTFEVAATSNAWTTVAVDLMTPTTGPAEPELYHVDSIKIDLPATGAGGAEDWELDDIRLTFDPNTDRQPSIQIRCYDPPDCISTPADEEAEPPVPAVIGDYTGGLQAFVEGLHTMGFPEGLENHRKCEASMYQRERYRHCPDYTGTPYYLDFVRSLAYQELILNLQEGWTHTNNDIENDAANKDASETKMVGDFYMFDVLRSKEIDISGPDVTYEWPGAPITRTWQIVGGRPIKLYYEALFQAKVRGMAVKLDRSDRYRGTGSVTLYGRPTTGGAWVLEDTDTPDENGRFTLGPVKALDREYRIGDVGTTWLVSRGAFDVLNDARYGLIYLVGESLRCVTDLRLDYVGRCWVAATDDEALPQVARFAHTTAPLSKWVRVTATGEYSHPSIVPLPTGMLVLALHDVAAGHGAIFRSRDDGESWVKLTMAHFLDDLELPDHAEMPGTGVLYGVGIDEDAVWVEWSDDGGDSKGEFNDTSTRKKIVDLVLAGDALPASIEVLTDSALRVATVDDNGTKFWTSRDRGENWTQLT